MKRLALVALAIAVLGGASACGLRRAANPPPPSPQGGDSKTREEAYWTAYRFLRKHSIWMQYADYRRVGMPIGSGVTEAACKTVFTQRLKRSGMAWNTEGGQVVNVVVAEALEARYARLVA